MNHSGSNSSETAPAPEPDGSTPAAALNKHQQRTASTQRALLAAGRRIFSRDGFERCRIEDIAAAAGYTRGAFYAHFQGKEDLFFALLEQQANARLAEIRATLERCRDAKQGLKALRDYYVQRASDRQWAMLMLEFKLFALRHPELRAKLAGTHRRIRASLKLEVIDRLLRARAPGSRESEEVTKVALEALLNGLLLENAYDPERISKEQVSALLGQYFDLLMRPGK